MNRKERAMAVVQGRQPDRTPTAFSLHFPAEQAKGAAAVKAHLDFFKAARTDICKIMNENMLRGAHQVNTPADLFKEAPTSETLTALDEQVALVSDIADGIKGDAVVLATVHGPMVSIQHMSKRPGFFVENLDFYRRCVDENLPAMKAALEVATEHLCNLTRRCIEAGADGIYFAALGSHNDFLTDQEYAEIVRPYDLEVLKAASGAPGFNVLHACHVNLAIRRFTDYPASVVNWEFGGHNPTMEDAFALFDKSYTIMGGLDNRQGPLLTGTDAELEAEVHRVLRAAGGRRFILGAGCTLPSSVDTARVAAAARACESYCG